MGHHHPLNNFKWTLSLIILSILSGTAGSSEGNAEMLLKCGGDMEQQSDFIRLFLGLNNLQVNCTLCTGSEASDYQDQNQTNTYTLAGLLPTMTIYNSTSSHTFPLMFSANSSSWRVDLARQDITVRTDVNPLHQWYVEITMSSSVGSMKNTVKPVRGTLLDTVREPILQWTIGEEVSVTSLTSLLSRVAGLKIAQSPCASDVAVMAPVFSPGEDAGVVLSVTQSAFSSQSRWFNATSSLCSLIELVPGCRGISVVDVKLTNCHLFLLTNRGLFISQDLLLSADAPLNFTLLQLPALAQVNYSSSSLWSPSRCLTRPIYYSDDTMSLTSSLHPHCVYSRFPFTKWHSCQADSSQRYLSFLYDRQQEIGLLLSHSGSQTATVSVFTVEGEVLRNRTKFPPVTIPFLPRGVILFDHEVVLYGPQVWSSVSQGFSFKPMLSLEGEESVVNVLSCELSGFIVFLTDRSRLYITKSCLDRFVQLNVTVVAQSTLLCDHMGVLTVLSVEPNAPSRFSRSVINIDKLIQEYRSGFNRPLALQYVSASAVLLLEHQPIHTPEHTPQNAQPQSLFSAGDVGRTIFLRDGGQVIITKVFPSRYQSGFTGGVIGEILRTIRGASLQAELGQHCSLLVRNASDGLNVELWLEGLDTCLSFNSSHIGQTVVVPGNSSYLITGVLPGGVAVANPTMPVFVEEARKQPSSLHAAAGWLLFNLAGSTSWDMREAPCRHALQSLDGLRRGSLVRIHLGQQLNFTFRAVITDSSCQRNSTVQRKKQIRVVSQLSPIQISADHHWDASNNHLVTLKATSMLNKKSISTVSLHISESSLLCTFHSFSFMLENYCPWGSSIVHLLSDPVTDQDWLRGNPIDSQGRPRLFKLPANYRPPSPLANHTTISDNVYNADPNNHSCTDVMRLSQRAVDSDCRQRVLLLTPNTNFTLRLFLRRPGKPDRPLLPPYFVTVAEVNNRDDWRITGTRAASLQHHLQGRLHPTLFEPDGLQLSLLGLELFHFRVSLVSDMAFCDLEEEVQVYVSSVSMPTTAIHLPIFFTMVALLLLLSVLHYNITVATVTERVMKTFRSRSCITDTHSDLTHTHSDILYSHSTRLCTNCLPKTHSE